MSAGLLRDRVTFQRQGLGVGDGAGNFGSGFADLANCVGVSADLKPLRSSEVVLAEGIQGRRLFEVTLRYSRALSAIGVGDVMVDHRDPSRRFNVKAPALNTDGKARFLQVLVEQGGADG